MRLKLFFLFSFLAYNIAVMSANCDKPSRYETNRYDYLYGWDKLVCSPEDSVWLSDDTDSLKRILCILRENGRSRARFNSLPESTRRCKYTQQLRLSDGTVPVWKLIVNKPEKKEEVAPIDTVYRVPSDYIPHADSLPEKFESYLTSTSTIPPAWEFAGLGVHKYTEPVQFTTGTTSARIWLACDGNFDEYGRTSTDRIPKIKFRLFVDSTATLRYVDHYSEQNIGCLTQYIDDLQAYIKSIRFIPGMTLGVPANSVYEIWFIPWQYTEAEYERIRKEREAGRQKLF